MGESGDGEDLGDAREVGARVDGGLEGDCEGWLGGDGGVVALLAHAEVACEVGQAATGEDYGAGEFGGWGGGVEGEGRGGGVGEGHGVWVDWGVGWGGGAGGGVAVVLFVGGFRGAGGWTVILAIAVCW